MKAKDLTQDDVGKWVMLRGKIVEVMQPHHRHPVHIDYGTDMQWLPADTILEFTDPPAPIQKIGDVFRMRCLHGVEFTLASIVGNACLLTRKDGGHQSAYYPLNSSTWTPVK